MARSQQERQQQQSPRKGKTTTTPGKTTFRNMPKKVVQTARNRAKSDEDDPGPRTLSQSESERLVHTATATMSHIWTLSSLVKLAKRKRRRIEVKLWSDWEEEITQWTGTINEYDDFAVEDRTWENVATELFTTCDCDDSKVIATIYQSFDKESAETEMNPSQQAVLARVRQVIISAVILDPTSLFRIRDEPNNEGMTPYWDKSGRQQADPILRSDRHASRVWLLACELLGWPWTKKKQLPCMTIWKVLASKRPSSNAREIQLIDKEEDGNGEVEHLASDSPTTPKRLFPLFSQHSTSTSKQPQSTTVTPVSQGESTAALETTDSDRPSGVSFQPSSKKAKRIQDEDESPSMETDDHSASSTGLATGAFKNMDVNDPITQPYRTALETPPLPTKKVFISDDEKAANLLQLNMEGLPFHHCYIYATTFVLDWDGAEEPKGNTVSKKLLKVWTSLMKNILMAAAKTGSPLRILPISDKLYRKAPYWLSSPEAISNKIVDFNSFRPYIDFDYGNSKYFIQGRKEGRKTLRTRMRFGFDDDPSDVKTFLHDIIQEEMSFQSGCYDSPLQRGQIVKIGSVAFWPQELNHRRLAYDIIDHLDYKIPVGLGYEWIDLPKDYGQAQSWNDSPNSFSGVQLWHVYTERKHAAEVEHRLTNWLNPASSRSSLPWAAPAHFFPNWRSMEKGYISTPRSGKAKEWIKTVAVKAYSWRVTTVQLFSQIPIRSMTNLAKTSAWDEVSLLKLLSNIIVTPTQARLAESRHAEVNDTEDEHDSDKEEGSQLPPKVSSDESTKGSAKHKSSRKKNKLKQQTPPDIEDGTTDPLSDLTKQTPSFTGTPKQIAEQQRQQKLLAADRENLEPCHLFPSILPAEHDGYVFTVRDAHRRLAMNVLDNIIPFLMFHLEEDSPTALDKILGKWFPSNCIQDVRKRGLVWNPRLFKTTVAESHAKRTPLLTTAFVDALDPLGMHDTAEAFEGHLEIDMDRDLDDIDDGATIGRIIAEDRRRDILLETSETERVHAIQELQIHQITLHKQAATLESQTQRLQFLEEQLARYQNDNRGEAVSGDSDPTGDP